MILDKIVAHKIKEVRERKQEHPLRDIVPLGRRGFFKKALSASGINLIAEVKKASPSKGVLIEDFNPQKLALLYEGSGAAAVSVLTDEVFFQGSLEDLVSVRETVRIPILRKEFIIDPYQLYESRYAGADGVLLIAGILPQETLKEFIQLAGELGLDPLVEIHSREELEKALASGGEIIGINNRDLKTFQVDLNTTLNLLPYIPKGCLAVSESGIRSAGDINKLAQAGVNAFLVGEALVRAEDPGAKVKELLGVD